MAECATYIPDPELMKQIGDADGEGMINEPNFDPDAGFLTNLSQGVEEKMQTIVTAEGTIGAVIAEK